MAPEEPMPFSGFIKFKMESLVLAAGDAFFTFHQTAFTLITGSLNAR